MLNFIRLVRPINIVIIFLTMYALRFFYTDVKAEYSTSIYERIDFFLLVVSILLVAAGGNIINDYFDVKADKINKPDKLIISKYIKQRWAILSHWFLNGLALLIASYLSIKYQSFSFVFIHLVCINVLWFYSVYFKRKAFIGNFLVALLTAVVPLISGMYFSLLDFQANIDVFQPFTESSWFAKLFTGNYFLYIMAIFAFILNLAREVIKDIQDVEGDKLLYAKTLPILYGITVTKFISILILLVLPIGFSLLIAFQTQISSSDLVLLMPIFGIQLIILICILFLLNNKFKIAGLFLKIAMFIGILLPFWWYFSK